MQVSEVMRLARKHLNANSAYVTSAVHCLNDAHAMCDENKISYAYDRALRSLAYSIGVCHPDYRRAKDQREV